MIGRTVSHYEIVERLGSGGMGEVYKARDTLLGRFVAVKVLPSELSHHPNLRRRFLREARSASALNHRGIVTIHDVVSAEGVDHIIMELIDGEPLDRVVPEGGLPPDRALDYAIQIADCLAAAHKAGVIHRDLKPGNVMITPDGDVKLLDFGLAKIEQAAPDQDAPTELHQAPLTQIGTVLGTLDFMSPEQAMGDPVDARSDIFSFGILLYILLTGQRPFRGKNAASILHAVAFEEHPSLADHRVELSGDLQAVVDKALRKKREDRFQSMAEVAEVLRRLQGELPSVAGSSPVLPAVPRAEPGSTERSSILSSPRARRGLAAAVGLALLVTVAVLAVPSLRTWAAGSLPADSGGGSGLAAHELVERGFSALERHDLEGNLERATADFQRVLSKNETNAPALAGLARAYWIDARYEGRDKTRLEQALAVAERAVERDELLVLALTSRGLVYQELGRLEEAAADFRSALGLEPGNAAAHFGSGLLHEARGELAAAEAAYQRAIEAAPGGWLYYAHLGTLLNRQGRYQEAERTLSAGVEAVPDNARNHRNLGVVHYMQGRLTEAATAFQRALQLEPDPWLYSNLGTIQFAQGLYPQAVSAFEKAVESGGANSYPVWGNLGDAYRWTPDHEEKARDAYLRALQLLEEKLAAAPDDPTLGSRKALYLAKRGDREKALAEISRLTGLDLLDAAARYRLAVAYEITGRREQALETLAEALREGYSRADVESDPELLELRRDPGYHLRVAQIGTAGS